MSRFALGVISGATAAYLIEQSVLFDGAAYTSRTPSVAGNRKTWTFSAWVKQAGLDANQQLLNARVDSSNYTNIRFTSANQIEVAQYTSAAYVARYITTAVFRDTSAWMHVVVAVNNGVPTLSVNGTTVTVFGTETVPASGTDWTVNSTAIHALGAFATGANIFAGRMARVELIDGSALAASAFGETDGNGFWNPIAYSETYGTNGALLDFAVNTDYGTDVNYTAAAAVTFTDSSVNTTAQTTYTFSSQAIGTASTDRVVAVGVSAGNSPNAVSTMTIGGVSAVKAIDVTNGTETELWYATVPTGTTGDVVIVFAGGKGRCGIGVWAMTGVTGVGNTNTSISSTSTLTVSGRNDAIVLGVWGGKDHASVTWSGLTEDFDIDITGAGSQYISGASKKLTATGSNTVTVTPNVGATEVAAISAVFLGTGDNGYLDSGFATTDQTNDTPTNSSTDGDGNFSQWNPLDGGTGTLSEGNLVSVGTTDRSGTIGVSSGKWAWKVTANATAAFGLVQGSLLGTESTYSATSADVLEFQFNADTGALDVSVNGGAYASVATGLTSGPYFPLAKGACTADFGQSGFVLDDSAFKYIATQNLPAAHPLYTGTVAQYREDAPLDGIRHTANDFDGASGGDTASFSFTSQSFGEAASDRYILVAASGRKSGGTGTNTGVASMTIGGVSAAQIVTSTSNSANIIQLWGAAVPTGTSGTVAITWNVAQNKCGIGVYKMTGRNTTAITTTSSTAAPLTSGAQFLNSRASLIGAAYTGDTATATWADATEDYDTSHGGESWSQSGAVNNSVGSRGATTTCTWTTSDAPGAIFAIFEAS